MIIVTGGSGMIGSNIIAELNKKGYKDILLVDSLKNGKKIVNLSGLDITDYIDKVDFQKRIEKGEKFRGVEAIFHQGACSATTEWDGDYLMDNNFNCSKKILQWCSKNGISMIYASSASVYGMGTNGFTEKKKSEKPINAYAFSKLIFDNYVRKVRKDLKTQVVGLRYFNVYGLREQHKGSMASTPFHFNNQVIDSNKCNVFGEYDGYRPGEHKRDFVSVIDCVNVNLWFLENKSKHGIYNVGTGKCRTFNDVAEAVERWHKNNGKSVEKRSYIEFPEHLKGSYQSWTQADISALRSAGYESTFLELEEGINKYLDVLNKKD